ncbi:MAG: hypothetical protein ACI9QD_000104 [Thermoproteota archaeon]|jgi:hypothetical protein
MMKEYDSQDYGPDLYSDQAADLVKELRESISND